MLKTPTDARDMIDLRSAIEASAAGIEIATSADTDCESPLQRSDSTAQ